MLKGDFTEDMRMAERHYKLDADDYDIAEEQSRELIKTHQL